MTPNQRQRVPHAQPEVFRKKGPPAVRVVPLAEPPTEQIHQRVWTVRLGITAQPEAPHARSAREARTTTTPIRPPNAFRVSPENTPRKQRRPASTVHLDTTILTRIPLLLATKTKHFVTRPTPPTSLRRRCAKRLLRIRRQRATRLGPAHSTHPARAQPGRTPLLDPHRALHVTRGRLTMTTMPRQSVRIVLWESTPAPERHHAPTAWPGLSISIRTPRLRARLVTLALIAAPDPHPARTAR